MRLRALPLFVLPLFVACGGADESIGTVQEPIKVCPGASTLAGIDASHWQGAITWSQVKGSGRSFALVKATEGTTFVDAMFATNWAQMKQQGVVRSATHFFHSNVDPILQADHFLQIMGPLQVGDLPPSLDLEVADGQSGATITSTAVQWLDYVAQATGMKPIVYTTPSFVTGTMGSPPGFQTHATLWIANWGVACPDVPTPFASWKFWQTSDTGVVPGVSGAVDLDTFNGTLTDLIALTKQPPGGSSSSVAASSSGVAASSAASSGAGIGGGSGVGGSSGFGGAGGLMGTPEVTSGPSAGHGAGVGTGSGEGGGDLGIEPGNPGCTCSMPGYDDQTTLFGAMSLFALAGVLVRRGRARPRRSV